MDEAGRRRAFRIDRGRVTIGSGAGAELRLTGAGLADVHAELEVRGDDVVLTPRPGVLPPSVGGRAAGGAIKLRPGVPVRLVDAVLTLMGEGEDVGAARPAPSAAAPAAVAPVRSRSERGLAPRRAKRRGSPLATLGWTLGAILVGALLVWKVVVPLMTHKPPAVFEPQVRLQRARDYMRTASWESARRELERIPRDAALSEEVLAEIDALRAELDERRDDSRRAELEQRGTKWAQTFLRDYEKNYLAGSPDPSRVRVFLKRARQFRERYPDHPELDWVARQESRFRDVVSLDDPPTFADVEFEVTLLTQGRPREYDEAARVLDRFATVATGADRELALALREEKRAEEEAWVQDRLQQARFEYENDNLGEAVGWLRSLAVHSSEQAWRDDAARRLLKFQGVDGWLEAHRRQFPDSYEELARNPVIAEYLRSKGDS